MSINHPNQHDAAKHGIIKVFIGDAIVQASGVVEHSDWTNEQREQIGLALFAMRALGPDFHFVAHENEADVSIRHWASDERGEALACGQYTPSKRLIQIDPFACHGYTEFRTAVAHEMGHYLGMQHIARNQHDVEALAKHALSLSPVGHGIAVMNPHVSYGCSEIDFDRFTGELACDIPTYLDVEEFNRTHSYADATMKVPSK